MVHCNQFVEKIRGIFFYLKTALYVIRLILGTDGWSFHGLGFEVLSRKSENFFPENLVFLFLGDEF